MMKATLRPNAWLVLAGMGLVGLILWTRSPSPAGAGERKIVYYQDSMHPWIKLDHPGKCTICAMDLTPIYEGEAAVGLGDDVVVLSADSITVMNVQAEEVTRRSLELTLHVAGTLEANETRKTVLAAPAAGRIERLNVDYAGVEVEQGEVLITFYSPELALEKRRYLVRSRVSTQRDPYAATPTSALDLAKVSVESDPYFQDLISPQSGTVVDRNVYQGQYVAEGDTLFTIVDSSLLWFRFDVYENQLGWLVPGQALDVTVPALPGKTFPAVISFIEPTVDPVTRTVKVRADIANPEVELAGGQRMRLLRYGMYADGFVRVEVPDVLSVARGAILQPGARAYAYVDKGGGAYERRRIRLGRQGDRRCEVLEGLDEGDRVVTAGNVLIDAQAQFARREEPGDETARPGAEGFAGRGSVMPGMGSSGSGGAELPPPQKAALEAFLGVADSLAQALAADDLPRAQAETVRLSEVAAALPGAFPAGQSGHEDMERVVAAVGWPAPADLAGAREAFLPFSSAVVNWVQTIRAQPGAFRDLKVYHCPMAPKPGLWVQLRGPLQNPFFGSRMLRCGEEVPPPKPAALPMVATPPAPSSMAMGVPAVETSHPLPMPGEKPHQPTETSVVPVSPVTAEPGPEDSPADVQMPERVVPPQLPQAAGPGIRSGRRSVGMAFWQRAAELYSSTRPEGTTNAPAPAAPTPEPARAHGEEVRP